MHLHSKSFGALKWPLQGGSRLIEVAATAGLTVVYIGLSLLYSAVPLQHYVWGVLGGQWLSGRVLDSRLRGGGFEPHRRH